MSLQGSRFYGKGKSPMKNGTKKECERDAVCQFAAGEGLGGGKNRKHYPLIWVFWPPPPNDGTFISFPALL